MEIATKQLYKWSEEYSVGIPLIDEQHKKLFDIINQLFTAFSEQKANEVLDKILKELIDYADYHFSAEEKYLEEIDFMDKDTHAKKHKMFFEKIQSFIKDKDKKQMVVTYQLMSFLRNWLIDHIMIEDFQYKDFINSNRLKIK